MFHAGMVVPSSPFLLQLLVPPLGDACPPLGRGLDVFDPLDFVEPKPLATPREVVLYADVLLSLVLLEALALPGIAPFPPE